MCVVKHVGSHRPVLYEFSPFFPPYFLLDLFYLTRHDADSFSSTDVVLVASLCNHWTNHYFLTVTHFSFSPPHRHTTLYSRKLSWGVSCGRKEKKTDPTFLKDTRVMFNRQSPGDNPRPNKRDRSSSQQVYTFQVNA